MIPILLDYETLRLLWWGLLGVLLIGFAIMDGFDMGVAFLNLLIGRTDVERRVIINTVGPVWEGNQVWLLLGAGAIFAAFPAIYAAAFSGFYIAMLLVLLSLIVRPVSMEYRNKFALSHRKYWDCALFASGLVPPLVFGVAFGNLFEGVPFFLDAFLNPHYVPGDNGIASWLGGLGGLLNPFALLCGVVSLAMLVAHGGVFLAAKTRGILQKRATGAIYIGLLFWLITFLSAGVWIREIEGYQIVNALSHTGPSNPLLKEVTRGVGFWLNNYNIHLILYLIPGIAILACFSTAVFTRINCRKWAFFTNSVMIASTIITAGVALFPMLLPSSFNPNHSLTVWDASSSRLTLWLMTLAALLFVPIIIFYTRWVFRVMRGPLTEDDVKKSSDSLY